MMMMAQYRNTTKILIWDSREYPTKQSVSPAFLFKICPGQNLNQNAWISFGRWIVW